MTQTRVQPASCTAPASVHVYTQLYGHRFRYIISSSMAMYSCSGTKSVYLLCIVISRTVYGRSTRRNVYIICIIILTGSFLLATQADVQIQCLLRLVISGMNYRTMRQDQRPNRHNRKLYLICLPRLIAAC